MKLKNKIILLFVSIAAFIAIAFGVVTKNNFLMSFDAQIANLFTTVHFVSLDKLMLAVTKLGDMKGAVIIFAVLGLYIILKKKKYLFYIFSISAALGIISVEAIKMLVERARPAMNLLIETGSSFPSAHATVATVFLLSAIFLINPLLQNRFSKIIWLTISIIIFPLIAISRIYFSVHFASDVIAGILLGCISYLLADIIIFHNNFHKE